MGVPLEDFNLTLTDARSPPVIPISPRATLIVIGRNQSSVLLGPWSLSICLEMLHIRRRRCPTKISAWAPSGPEAPARRAKAQRGRPLELSAGDGDGLRGARKPANARRRVRPGVATPTAGPSGHPYSRLTLSPVAPRFNRTPSAVPRNVIMAPLPVLWSRVAPMCASPRVIPLRSSTHSPSKSRAESML